MARPMFSGIAFLWEKGSGLGWPPLGCIRAPKNGPIGVGPRVETEAGDGAIGFVIPKCD